MEAEKMRGTKEFHDLMNQFEKDLRNVTYGHKVDRVSEEDKNKVPASVFYNDGHVNEMFHIYMRGYNVGKISERMGGL